MNIRRKAREIWRQMNSRPADQVCKVISMRENQMFKPWIEIALKEIGVKESSPNTGKRVQEYQSATTLGGTGWPWCAAFVCWCLQKWNPQEASVYGLRDWAKKNGLFRDKSTKPKSGWVVLFDFEPNKDGGTHCGFVTYVPAGANFFITVEGNTSPEKSGGAYTVAEERNGGMVAERKRGYGSVIGWIEL